MRTVFKYIIRATLLLLFVALLYLTTLFFPQPFFKYNLSVGNITVYSDNKIPKKEATQIIKDAQRRIAKSKLYNKTTKHRIFIATSDLRWKYFTNINYKVGGLNYVAFNHNVFLRRADISGNRLYGLSGKRVVGDRTLSYFMAHEMSHTLEFQARPWYTYPIQTNWILEGYAEYIAYNSISNETALEKYLNSSETSKEKYYTRIRVLTAYLLEKEGVKELDLHKNLDRYDELLKKAIPKNTSLGNNDGKQE